MYSSPRHAKCISASTTAPKEIREDGQLLWQVFGLGLRSAVQHLCNRLTRFGRQLEQRIGRERYASLPPMRKLEEWTENRMQPVFLIAHFGLGRGFSAGRNLKCEMRDA